MTPTEVLIAAVIGLAAGLVGGLCGIGGSIVMLPALGLLFGYDDEENTRHHLYIASAMLVNAVVAATALRPHIKAKAIDKRIVVGLLPPMAIAIVGGVALSDQASGRIPKLALVGFLFAFVAWTLFTAIRQLPEPRPERARGTPTRLGSIGLVAGFAAGFLGVGGGVIMVPSMQLLARLPLRKAIAASATAMCVTAPIGAFVKFANLSMHGFSWLDALVLGLAMAVGASIGSPLGARLTHKLKLPQLRLVVSFVLAIAGAKLAGVF